MTKFKIILKNYLLKEEISSLKGNKFIFIKCINKIINKQ